MLSQGKAESINQLISYHQHFLTVCTGQTLETKCCQIITHLIPTFSITAYIPGSAFPLCMHYKITVSHICTFIFLFSAYWFIFFVNVFFCPLPTHWCSDQRSFMHSDLLYLSPRIVLFTFTYFATSKNTFPGYYSWLKVYVTVFVASVSIQIISFLLVKSVGEDSRVWVQILTRGMYSASMHLLLVSSDLLKDNFSNKSFNQNTTTCPFQCVWTHVACLWKV